VNQKTAELATFRTCPGGAVLFNRTLSGAKLMQMLNSKAPCIVAMEVCATSHDWGRVTQGYGHDVRLIPPIYVKPFVKRQKNDAADAAAIAEAVLRPNIHYVGVKSAEHQARAVAFRTHQCFVRQRTQLINALCGHLAEFGIVVAQGPVHLREVIGLPESDGPDLPAAVKEIARLYLDQIDVLGGRIEALASTLRLASEEHVETRRLCTVPGVGAVTAGAIMAFAPDLRTFASGRNFAAWLGLVPRQRSTGGKTRHGGVSLPGRPDRGCPLQDPHDPDR
jgi:transposase